MNSNLKLAGRGDRAVAQVADWVIAVLPLVLLLVVGDSLGAGLSFLLVILSLLWMGFHTLLADGLGDGQSLGKRFLGIRVVSEEDGHPCTFLQSFIRNVILSGLGPIDWVFIFGARRQRLGDRAAGTLVVDADTTASG